MAIDQKDWSGGRIFIARELNGYGVEHEPASGGRYSIAFERYRSSAIKKALTRSRQTGAAVFIDIAALNLES